MQSPMTYLKDLHNRYLASSLARHGRMITLLVRESQTVDDAANHPSPDQRYIHSVTANWTDPASGKAYEFRRQFRSLQEATFKTGDMVKVLIDPHNYRRYVVQI